jgi:cytochrome c-type biogenesis protein CcmH
MGRRYILALIGLALLAAVPSAAPAAPQRASLPDVEDEVMCPTCGTPLNLAFSPQAERERRFIRAQIAAGRSKEQIKKELVAEFGPSVLALPRRHGFELTAYLVPAGGVAIATIALVVGLFRWRRRDPGAGGPPPADLSPTDAARLERDLSRYDL